jgi:hypothetical protein
LCPQCGHNFRVGVDFVELAHPVEVSPFKPFDTWFLDLDEIGKLFNGLLAPFVAGEAIADVLTNRPVELDQFLVGGGDDAVLGGLDQGQDFGELGLEIGCHGGWIVRWSGDRANQAMVNFCPEVGTFEAGIHADEGDGDGSWLVDWVAAVILAYVSISRLGLGGIIIEFSHS